MAIGKISKNLKISMLGKMEKRHLISS